MTFEEQLKNFDEQIEHLEKEKYNLIKNEINSKDKFEDKFRIWFDHNMGLTISLCGLQSKCPNVHKYINRFDLDRYKTYDLLEWIDELYYVGYPEDIVEEEFTNKDEMYLLAKELFNANISRILIDW